MIAAPRHGFVFLAMPKCASTAIERCLDPFGQLLTRGEPALKHMTYRGFEQTVQPLLARCGYPRERYEVLCVFREPIEWLHSWWRYRARASLARPDAVRHRNYTGDVTFEQFCRAYIDGSEPYATTVGRQSRFVRGGAQLVGVDRIFRYDDLPAFGDHVAHRLGRRIDLRLHNVSPRGALMLPPATRAALREHLTPEYAIYDRVTVGAAHRGPSSTTG